jgi:pimeloyl-ACP methyl ester carboxylesterase
MFRDLIQLLSDRYHVLAPDYPGFGYSAMPSITAYDYTFDHTTDVIDDFVAKLNLKAYTLYVQDFGGLVGFRLATR